MSYKIIDNFLDQQDFQELKNIMLGNNFPWFYNNEKTYIDPNAKNDGINKDFNFQFTHSFYRDHGPQSQYWQILNSFTQKLNPLSYTRVKANLTPRTNEIIEYGYHKDYVEDPPGLKTAVFYINNNNGKTIFKNGPSIDSLENRLLVFDSDMMHTGTSCTDQNVRVLININFFPNK